jgi:hypothetical protein
MLLSNKFKSAAADYLFLLQKNYPKSAILKLIGDRYQLTGQERSMLFRGIHTIAQSKLRKEKQVLVPKTSENYCIDGYNVIRTIGSYLLGKPLFISIDGYLRDASEMHRTTLKARILNQTLVLIFDYLSKARVKEVIIYLDQPLSKSGELASAINKRLSETGITGLASTVFSPDHHLKHFTQGIICTSDSAIIDSCRVNVFDLAKAVLDENFKPNYINLEVMISSFL